MNRHEWRRAKEDFKESGYHDWDDADLLIEHANSAAESRMRGCPAKHQSHEVMKMLHDLNDRLNKLEEKI